MADLAPDTSGTAGAQCLLQYHALTRELETAIDAIARNSLAEFEHSLWQQEMLSTGLRRSLLLLKHGPIEPSLLADLRGAAASLQRVTRSYKSLIEQSSRAASLLRGICSLYQPLPHPAQTNQQALYCEA